LSGSLNGLVHVDGTQWLLKTKQKGDAHIGRYVQILDELGEDLTEKMAIVEIQPAGIVVVSEENLPIVAAEGV
jgi:hypothetical protein